MNSISKYLHFSFLFDFSSHCYSVCVFVCVYVALKFADGPMHALSQSSYTHGRLYWSLNLYVCAITEESVG